MWQFWIDRGGTFTDIVARRPDGSLVAHYMFDETSGTSAFDASGNGRTATLSGATFTAGRRGNGVRIAGGTQRVNLPANIVQTCTDLTITSWVRLTTNTAAWAHIFDFGRDTNFYMFLSPRADSTDVLRFAITTTGNGAVDDIVGLQGLARYVRVQCSARSGGWNLSMRELEVYP